MPRKKAAARTKVKASSKRTLSQEADSQQEGRVTRSTSASSTTKASMKVEATPKKPTAYQKKVADNKIAQKNARKVAREDKKKTLTEFTLFPKLPPELRRAIWRFALPSKDVMIPLHFSWLRGLFYKLNNFHYSNPTRPRSPFYVSPVSNGMLSTCWESRIEYIKANPKVVSSGHRAKIYYDPKATTIFLDNWRDWLMACEGAKRIRVGNIMGDASRDYEPPHWFADVELLAMGYDDFGPKSWTPRNSITVFGDYQESGNIELFQNLKKWIGIADTRRLAMGQRDNNAWVLKYQLELKKVEQALQVYKAKKNPSYNVPEIVYRDLTPEKERIVMGNWG